VAFVKRLVKSGAKVVLVVTGGSAIALGELADLVQAVVFVWYPGQEGGNAVADVLFGNRAPSGKLPVTFYKSVDQLPPFDDYRMDDRTYRYMTTEPLYPFGFGLSYTRFAYSDLRLSSGRIRTGESVSITFTLTNTGALASDEVAQVYLTDVQTSVPAPLQRLVGFTHVHLQPRERREIALTLTPEMMMLVGDDGQPRLEPGEFRLTVGGCSPGARGVALGAPVPVSAEFVLV
jgi:beta-glucosidase